MPRHPQPPVQEEVVADEVLAAYVVDYGGNPANPFNGNLVELGPYDADLGFFEVFLTAAVYDQGKKYAPGDQILCRFEELKPANEASAEYMKFVAVIEDVPAYRPQVYEIRDRLQALGIVTKPESIATWNEIQIDKIRSWLGAMESPTAGPRPPRPKELS